MATTCLKPTRHRIITARRRAKKKNLEFSLTLDWMIRHLKKAETHFSKIGLPFSYERMKNGGANPFSPSIDRVDCGKG